MTDPVDEFVTNSLTEFEGKQLKAVDRGQLDEGDAPSEEEQKELQPLFHALSERIAQVKEVRLSKRLRESAACLVADEYGMGAHMERLMKRMGRADEMPSNERILELNAEHAAVQALQKIFEKDPEDPRVEDYGRLLYDQAVLAEGSKVEDPAALARRINALISKAEEG
jgi:molecular chaperone HtpG